MASVDVSLRRDEPQHHGRGVPGRRTVTIHGRGGDRYARSDWGETSRRRPSRAVTRTRTRPDRIAMWAVLLGVMLVLAAATSSHAATLKRAHHGLIAAEARALPAPSPR